MIIQLRPTIISRILTPLCGFMLAFASPQAVYADAVDDEIKGLVMQFHNPRNGS